MRIRYSRLRAASIPAFLALLCITGATAFARHHHARQSDQTPGQFDYYLLTLSWSPTYCLVHPDDPYECATRGFGFILHGLWPQYDSGGYPENCAADTNLSEEAAKIGRTLYPSPRLMEHEWRAHGTCSGLDAVSYFRTADKATAAIRIPAVFEAPRNSLALSSAQITAQFLSANPRLPQNALTVACSRGKLSEVRVCLTRDLAPRACAARVRNSCPASPIEIPSSK